MPLNAVSCSRNLVFCYTRNIRENEGGRMEFDLKLFDIPLLRFEGNPQSANPAIRILWINQDNRDLLPIGMNVSDKGLWDWIRHRSIPQNRAFVHTLLARCGLSVNRPLGVIYACKGLSLNDSYWVTEAGFQGSFDKYNLYDNNISRILSHLAFTGYGSSPSGVLSSSPEFTTGGMLPKRWSRESGRILLYKGGTTGAANAGYEPFSEMYAAQVAQAMGANAIPYWLSKQHGVLSSVCELFTSKHLSFVPAAKAFPQRDFEKVAASYAQLGDVFKTAFAEMLVFDALICNTDRHYGNFGLLVDSATNQVVAPAPLFDHGNSLFYQAFGQDWENEEALTAYADTLQPRTYDNFIDTAQTFMTNKQRAQVRRLLTFDFAPSGRYQLPKKRRDLMAAQIRQRAHLLLG